MRFKTFHIPNIAPTHEKNQVHRTNRTDSRSKSSLALSFLWPGRGSERSSKGQVQGHAWHSSFPPGHLHHYGFSDRLLPPKLAKGFAQAGGFYDDGCYDAVSTASTTPATTSSRLSHGHLSSGKLSIRFYWVAWIILELQMPCCGYNKMPSRPCGNSHPHVRENKAK